MKRTFSKVALFAAAFAGVALTSCEPNENVGVGGFSGETTDVTLGVTVKSGAPTKATADEMNMGATAIGTGINADPDYPAICEKYLR